MQLLKQPGVPAKTKRWWQRTRKTEPESAVVPPRPRRGITVRIVEGAATLFCLLLSLQAFWLFMRSPQWAAAAGPASGIYIAQFGPAQLLNSWTPKSPPIDMTSISYGGDPQSSTIPVVVYVPQGTRAEIEANGVRLGDPPQVDDVTLRHGTNVITATAQNGAFDPDLVSNPVPSWMFLTEQWTSFPPNITVARLRVRPQKRLRIQTFSVKGGDGCEVFGFAEPDSTITVLGLGPDATDPVLVGPDGEFMIGFSDTSRARTLEFSYSGEHEATAAAHLLIPAGCSGNAGELVPLDRQVKISRVDHRTIVSFSGHIPAGTVLEEWVEKKQIAGPELLWHLTGLRSDDTASTDGIITQAIDEKGVHLTFQVSLPRVSGISYEHIDTLPLLLMDGDRLEVDDSFTTSSGLRPPDEVGKGSKVWYVRTASGHLPAFSVQVGGLSEISSGDESIDEEEEAPPEVYSGTSALQSVESHIPNFAREILRALLTALPFIWLLLLLGGTRTTNQHPGSRYGNILRGAAATFLLFHLTVLILPLFRFSLSFFNSFSLPFPLMEWFGLRGINAQGYLNAISMAFNSLGDMYPFLMIGICLLIRPLFKSYSRFTMAAVREHLGLRLFRWLLLWPIILVISILSVAIITLYFASTLPSSGQDEVIRWFVAHYPSIQGWYAATAIVIFWLFFYWPLRVSLRVRIRIRSVLLATLAMLAMPLAAPLLDLLVRIGRHQLMIRYRYYASFVSADLRQYLATAIVALIVAVLIDQIAYVTVYLTRSVKAFRLMHSRWRRLGLAGYFLFALPLTGTSVKSGTLADASLLGSLAMHVDYLLPYVLAVGIIRFMKCLNPQDSFVIPTDLIYSLGGLLFAFYLTGRTADVLFIPVPILLGWWLFRHMAIRAEDAEVPTPQDRDKSAELAALVEYRRAQPLVQELRESVEGKLKKAELSVADYQTKMSEAEALLAESAGKLEDSEDRVRERIFGQGPESGPWSNGIAAVKAGILFSTPFQIITLVQIPRSVSDPYFHLQWIASALFSFSFWTILAFLFGYFFHRLRGRDGLEKGLIFSLAVILPTIPQRLLGGEPIFQSAHLAQIFEILAFTLALGLITFDLRTVNFLKARWNDLVAIYGLKRIAGYGSSVVITTIAGLAGPALKAFLVELLSKSGLKLPM